MKKKPILTLWLVAVACSLLGLSAGYFYTVNKMDKKIQTAEESLLIEKKDEATEVAISEEKITPSTKIVYRYYYTEDKVLEEQEEVPPYFLLGLTLSDMLKYYTTWDIVSFSSKEVIMERTVFGVSNQRYVIGEKDGYIAVFYEEEQQGISLKEVTDIPVDGLVEEEKLKLKEGVKIIGKEALDRSLESYSS